MVTIEKSIRTQCTQGSSDLRLGVDVEAEEKGEEEEEEELVEVLVLLAVGGIGMV